MTNELRVGVIGGGNISRRLHLPTWIRTPGVQVVAVADPHPAALASARALVGLGDKDAHHDPLELIARSDVDIVDVCTPPSIRSDLIVAAAAAGKHVFAEKPLASSPSAAQRAVTAAAEAGVVLGMGHNYLVLDEVRAVCDVIDSGDIGEVRTATVNFLGVEYAPGLTGDWRHDPTFSGGGVLMDIIHSVYVLERFLGEPIQRASAYADSRDPAAHVEDLALCRFETASKAGLVNVGWGHGNGNLEITGTAGRISVRYLDGGTAPWAPLESVTVTTASGTRSVLGPEPRRPDDYDEFPPIATSFHRMTDDFLAAVRTGTSPLATGADGLRALECAVGAYASAATGQIVHIPLDRAGVPYQRGTVGVPDLPRPAWSPLERLAMFSPSSQVPTPTFSIDR